MKKKTNPGLKIICLNRKARFNYFFENIYEAGVVLKGSEIKSIRQGKVNIADSYGIEKDGEIYLINSHISPYKESSYNNHDPIFEYCFQFFNHSRTISVHSNNFCILRKVC